MLISLGLFSKHQEYYFLYFIHYDFVSFPPPAMASDKEREWTRAHLSKLDDVKINLRQLVNITKKTRWSMWKYQISESWEKANMKNVTRSMCITTTEKWKRWTTLVGGSEVFPRSGLQYDSCKSSSWSNYCTPDPVEIDLKVFKVHCK